MPLIKTYMTRNIIRGLLLLSMISLMSGCTDRGKLNPLGWERISPEADSLTLAIERTINNDESADSAEILLSKLRRVADTLSYTGNLNARLVLFETGILGLRHKSKEALAKIDSLKETVDSASDTYLFYRIKSREGFVDSISNYTVHKKLLEQLNYFTKTKDSVSLAANLIYLSQRYLAVADYNLALQSSKKADTILRGINYSETAFKNKINITIMYDCMGDSTARDSLILEMLNDKTYANNINFYSALLVNAYSFLHDATYLKEAYGIIKNDKAFAGRKAIAEALIADELRKSGIMDSASLYADMSFKGIKYVNNFSHRAEMCRIYHDLAIEDGDSLKAFRYYRLMKEYEDSARQDANPTATARINYAVELEKERLMLRQKKREDRLIAVIAVLLILVTGAVIIIILMIRHGRMKTMMAKATKERDKSYHAAALSIMSAKEKENRLRDMAEIVSTGGNENGISNQDKRRILSSLRVSIAESSDWNNFIEAFTGLHPDFEKELRKKFPTLSTKQVQLCCFIKMGLDTNRIAHLMSVKPETIWQNRWRLKQKMGLDSDESLQQLLNSISE